MADADPTRSGAGRQGLLQPGHPLPPAATPDQNHHPRARRPTGQPAASGPQRRPATQFDTEIYKQRNTVERAINKLKGYRAVAPIRKRNMCEMMCKKGASGSQIIDNRSLTTLKLHGPACRDVTEFEFQEAGQITTADLEHSPAGGTVDLSYDHFTGELKPINGARVALYYKDNGWPGWLGNEPGTRSDYPGEQECQGKRNEELDTFSKEDLAAEFSIFCIKTAEGHDGFLIVRLIAKQKPAAYSVYTYIWVR